MSTLLVEPKGGRWVVRREGASLPLSDHPDANEAARSALARHEAQVLLRDRYHRVRPLPPRAPRG
jgi:hypothetical protein